MATSASDPVPDDENKDLEETMQENKTTVDMQGFLLSKAVFDIFYHLDHSMVRAWTLKQLVEKGLGGRKETYLER